MMPALNRYQSMMLTIILLSAVIVMATLISLSTTKSERIAVAALPERNSNKDTSVTQKEGKRTFIVQNTAAPSPPSTTIEKFNKKVPLHVAAAISKLYHELKANGSIINDLLATKSPIIPNVYHYIRFNQPHMRFHEMLSIKSALKVGRAAEIFIHTNKEPKGRFWDMIKGQTRIKIVHRDPPKSIYGKAFNWVHHGSDLARIQVLREHGGIYLDNDCIVVNEFDRIRKHHCVVSKSSSEPVMGNMVLMATKDCVFMRMYEELYKLDYRADLWYYNGGQLPVHALLEPYPGIAFMADEGVQQGMMYWLWKLNKPVTDVQRYWNIIHLYYGHKHYIYNDTTEYDEVSIRTKDNTFSRIARWLYYDHENSFDG